MLPILVTCSEGVQRRLFQALKQTPFFQVPVTDKAWGFLKLCF